MSVVVGVSLFNGILLAADSRGSYGRIRRDCVQKLFTLGPHTACGFVGDFSVANVLLPDLIGEVQRRGDDPYTLSRWLPGFLRNQYGTQGCNGAMGLMVGSVLRGRPNVVLRQDAADLMNRFVRGDGVVRMNGIDLRFLIPVLSTPPDHRYVLVPGTSRGALYTMEAPEFRRQRVPTLKFAAIGSGWRARGHVATHQNLILAGGGGDFVETEALRTAVDEYLTDHGDQTVGGLIPVVKIDANGVTNFGQDVRLRVGTPNEVRIMLDPSGTGWRQINVTKGKERPLLPPWQLPENLPVGSPDDRFDDLWSEPH